MLHPNLGMNQAGRVTLTRRHSGRSDAKARLWASRQASPSTSEKLQKLCTAAEMSWMSCGRTRYYVVVCMYMAGDLAPYMGNKMTVLPPAQV
jgi:hypothetical protein